MAMPILSVPQYPDVPQANGVPPVLRQVGAVINTVVLLAADAKLLLQGLFGGPQWGIFSPSGAPALVGDSVVGVDFRSEWRVADYPMEQGAFASYNKVTEPFDVRVTFSNSGQGTILSSFLSGGLIGSLITGSSPGVTNRKLFLTAIDRAADSLNVYTVVTPEFSYPYCTITHYDYRREARKGAALIEIDVWLRQIRQFASKAFTTPPATPATPGTPTTASPGTASGSSAGTSATGSITSTANAQSPSAVDATSTGTVQATPLGTGDTPSAVRTLQPGEPDYSATTPVYTNLSPADYAKFSATIPAGH